jgi:hypothetical protein
VIWPIVCGMGMRATSEEQGTGKEQGGRWERTRSEMTSLLCPSNRSGTPHSRNKDSGLHLQCCKHSHGYPERPSSPPLTAEVVGRLCSHNLAARSSEPAYTFTIFQHCNGCSINWRRKSLACYGHRIVTACGPGTPQDYERRSI